MKGERWLVAVAALTGAVAVPFHLSPFTFHAVPTAVLDKDAVLNRFSWDNADFTWYKAHIPFFESPDSDIDATYYYRWELVTKHLTYGSQQSGYTFTEFIDRPFWSGAYGAISCPLGHQMYEIRWLKDHPAVEDFSRYWFDTPGAQPRSYSNWYGDAVWATYMVSGNKAYLGEMLPHMEAQVKGWDTERYDPVHRMYHWDGLHDGMEMSINSRLTNDAESGADGYRPTLNSYLYADMRAIANARALFGDSLQASEYRARAAGLKQRIQQELWDPTRNFFLHQFANDEKDGIRAKTLTYRSGPYAGNSHGREEIGFVPWQFNLPDAGYESAWKYLMDTAYFFSPRGPSTTERHDPQFRISPRCCVWSGNEWPYATTQTLVAMANLLNNYRQTVVSKSDYAKLFKVYTLDQRKDGKPYVAEAANPDNGSWDGHNTFNHSEHYFHSGYVDLVVTGIAGLRPRADDTLEVNPLAPADWNYFALDDVRYHGHNVSIVWDRDGSRYHLGAGLTLLSDGAVIARSAVIGRIVGYLGETRDEKRATRVQSPDGRAYGDSDPRVWRDSAVNIVASGGHPHWPYLVTSYSAPGTSPHYLNDGNYWYGRTPPNRWTTEGSPNNEDWIEIHLGSPYSVQNVVLYFLDDSTGVHAPRRYDIEAWRNGKWIRIPGQVRAPATPTGHLANRVTFPAIDTYRLRIRLVPQTGSAVGLTEIESWQPPQFFWDMFELRRQGEKHMVNVAEGAQPSASFTSKFDKVEQLNDNTVAFSHYSRNRWTSFGSSSSTDWVQLDFPGPTRIDKAELFLWGDGGGVQAPRSYTLQTWDGNGWREVRIKSQVPLIPQVSSVNTVWFSPVTTSKIRVTFVHALPAASGVTELRVWGQR